MSRSIDWNALACLKYRSTFGNKCVFSLRNAEKRDHEFHATRMFGVSVSYQKLASLITQGAEIKVTNLSEEFDLNSALARQEGN